MKEEIEFALNELADYNPSDYYPKEYIDTDDELLELLGTGGSGSNEG